jgi:hypothetical protein
MAGKKIKPSHLLSLEYEEFIKSYQNQVPAYINEGFLDGS